MAWGAEFGSKDGIWGKKVSFNWPKWLKRGLERRVWVKIGKNGPGQV